jgi:hypothetical protein
MKGLFDDENEMEETTEKVEVTEIVKMTILDNEICVPLHYQIFSTSDNTPTGHKEIIDTYACDRAKGIVPTARAKGKADGMKKCYPTKTYFVIGFYELISERGSRKETEIIYQTK